MSGLRFSDFNSKHANSMRGGASAAGLASVAENFNALRRGAADLGGLGSAAVQAAGAVNRGVEDANNYAKIKAMEAENIVDIAKIKGKHGVNEARKDARSSTFGNLAKAGAQLAGAAIMFSDETTKNTIEKIDDALGMLRELKPVTYYYNEEYSSSPERLHHGFIAQDYQKVMPDATYLDESTGKLCIDTTELISLLVRGIQQLETRVARMEAANALVGV
mgnify:CR=1 FL=1